VNAFNAPSSMIFSNNAGALVPIFTNTFSQNLKVVNRGAGKPTPLFYRYLCTS
jgi:hypothetical protein